MDLRLHVYHKYMIANNSGCFALRCDFSFRVTCASLHYTVALLQLSRCMGVARLRVTVRLPHPGILLHPRDPNVCNEAKLQCTYSLQSGTWKHSHVDLNHILWKSSLSCCNFLMRTKLTQGSKLLHADQIIFQYTACTQWHATNLASIDGPPWDCVVHFNRAANILHRANIAMVGLVLSIQGNNGPRAPFG